MAGDHYGARYRPLAIAAMVDPRLARPANRDRGDGLYRAERLDAYAARKSAVERQHSLVEA